MKCHQDVLLDWIERCANEADLNDWETQFLESIEDQLVRTGHLTQTQVDKLERIYTEKVP